MSILLYKTYTTMVILLVILTFHLHIVSGNENCKLVCGYGAKECGNCSCICTGGNWIDAAELKPDGVFFCLEKCNANNTDCSVNTTCFFNVTHFENTGVCLCTEGYNRSSSGHCVLAVEREDLQQFQVPTDNTSTNGVCGMLLPVRSPSNSMRSSSNSHVSTQSMRSSSNSHVSTQSMTSSSSSHVSTQSMTSSTASLGKFPATTVGLSIGIGFGILVLLGVVVLLVKRRRKRKPYGSEKPYSIRGDLHVHRARRDENVVSHTSQGIDDEDTRGDVRAHRISDISTASSMYSNHKIAKNRNDNQPTAGGVIPEDYNALYSMGRVSIYQNV